MKKIVLIIISAGCIASAATPDGKITVSCDRMTPIVQVFSQSFCISQEDLDTCYKRQKAIKGEARLPELTLEAIKQASFIEIQCGSNSF